jgi:hypothetical protein
VGTGTIDAFVNWSKNNQIWNDPFQIKKTKKSGFGVFAIQEILKGRNIGPNTPTSDDYEHSPWKI